MSVVREMSCRPKARPGAFSFGISNFESTDKRASRRDRLSLGAGSVTRLFLATAARRILIESV